MHDNQELRVEIRYLYYDWPGKHSAVHREELAQLADLVAGEIRFAASTYQELYAALRAEPETDEAYLEYLRLRYFADPPR